MNPKPLSAFVLLLSWPPWPTWSVKTWKPDLSEGDETWETERRKRTNGWKIDVRLLWFLAMFQYTVFSLTDFRFYTGISQKILEELYFQMYFLGQIKRGISVQSRNFSNEMKCWTLAKKSDYILRNMQHNCEFWTQYIHVTARISTHKEQCISQSRLNSWIILSLRNVSVFSSHRKV